MIPAGRGIFILEDGYKGFAIKKSIACGYITDFSKGGENIDMGGQLLAVMPTGKPARWVVNKKGYPVPALKDGGLLATHACTESMETCGVRPFPPALGGASVGHEVENGSIG